MSGYHVVHVAQHRLVAIKLSNLTPFLYFRFYAPWCPHCQHYKPKYIQLAKKIKAVHPSMEFHAVSCVAHHEICKQQEVNSYPTLKFFKEGSYENMPMKFVNVNAKSVLALMGYEDKISSLANEDEHEDKSHNNIAKETDTKQSARVIPFQNHEVSDSWHDASLSFEFALQHGIYMSNGPLSEKEKDAFKEWLELLSKALPPQMQRTRETVTVLLKNFDTASHSQKEMLKLITGGFGTNEDKREWRTCTNEDNKIGYTCGLWQLFHVISVGVVEYNMHNEPIPTRHASETLRNYILHFFQCDVCRMHFLNQYDSCELDVCHRLSDKPSTSEHEWREFPMWLWETHNTVNDRLLRDRFFQNGEPKANEWESQQARWPSLFACPNCWREDRSWEEDRVYEHLHKVFWAGNPLRIKIDTTDGFRKSDTVGSLSFSWKLAGFGFAVALLVAWIFKSRKLVSQTGRHKKF